MPAAAAPTPGTSTPLTEDEGAERLKGILSALETKETRETPPAQDEEAEEPESEESNEESEEGSEQPEAEAESPADVEEADDAEDESETDESESDEQPEQPQLHTVKVDGQDQSVTLDELKKGYSRTADYTRKTQALAEDRKAVESERATIRERTEQYGTLLTQLKQVIENVTPKEPNWEELRATKTPEEFAATWADWQRYTKRMQTIESEREKATRELSELQAKELEKTFREESERLLDAIPEWKDDSKAKTERQQLIAFAESIGYTEKDVKSIVDHRAVVILRKAMLYDQLKSKQAQARPKTDKGLKPAKPGPKVPASKSKQERANRAMQRLAKTGSEEDAVAAIIAGGMLD